jgi:hypothetical protein
VRVDIVLAYKKDAACSVGEISEFVGHLTRKSNGVLALPWQYSVTLHGKGLLPAIVLPFSPLRVLLLSGLSPTQLASNPMMNWTERPALFTDG